MYFHIYSLVCNNVTGMVKILKLVNVQTKAFHLKRKKKQFEKYDTQVIKFKTCRQVLQMQILYTKLLYMIAIVKDRNMSTHIMF